MPKYYDASDVKDLVDRFIESLDLFYIDKTRVYCIRSRGSKARGVAARIHSFPKIYQKALAMKPIYIIEVISKSFDKLPQEEREKVLIHELLHIPKGFSGGFAHHRDDYETQVELYHRVYKSRQKRQENSLDQ